MTDWILAVHCFLGEWLISMTLCAGWQAWMCVFNRCPVHASVLIQLLPTFTHCKHVLPDLQPASLPGPQVISCIETGTPLLMENLPEDIDAVLDPVIGKQTIKRGRNLILKIGDAEVEYDQNFRSALMPINL